MAIEELDLSMFSDEDNTLQDYNEEEDKEPEGVDSTEGEEGADSSTGADGADETDDVNQGSKEGTEEEIEEGSEGKGVKLVYNNIAKLLKEEGMLNEEIDLEKVASSDDLVDAIKGEIKRNEFADLSDTQRGYLEAIRDGVPDKLFLEHKQAMTNFSQITETMIAENEDLRKNIILADLTSKGMIGTRAEKLYRTFTDAGDDIEEAVASLKILKDAEQAKYQKEVDNRKVLAQEQKDLEKSNRDRLKNRVYDTKEIIKNFKITEKLRDNVYDNMTKPVAYGEDGSPINKFNSDRDKNPIEFDTKLYYLYTMTKGFKDFSIFEKKAQSKAARELERVVKESNMLNIGGIPNIKDVDQTDVPKIIELS